MNILSIADIHIGSIPAKQHKRELDGLFNIIEKNKLKNKIDMICILGDIFHKKLFHNSGHAKLAAYFINRMKYICKKKKIILRFLDGTDSHDNTQLDNYEDFDTELNFAIKRDISIEMINGNKCLFISDIHGKKEDYQEFLDDEYDYIFFHGTFGHVPFAKHIDNAKHLVWEYTDFKCKNFIIGGHIHSHSTFNNVIYVGSYSRFVFGEEESKGFIFSEKINDTYNHRFIKNTLTQTYKDIDVTDIFLDDSISFESKLKQLDSFKELYNNIRFTYDESRLSDDKLELIKEFVSKSKNNKENKIFKIKSYNQNTRDIDDNKRTEYDFLFDAKSTFETKVSEFIKKEFKKDISASEISDIFNKINGR